MGHETSKCVTRRLVQGHLQKLVGSGIDIGGGDDSFRPLIGTCRSWDKRLGDGDAATLPGLLSESFDYVYSSHCLEHLSQPLAALKRWVEVIKPGGYLYLVVPDYELYEGGAGIRNRSHRVAFTIDRPHDPTVPLFNLSELVREQFAEIMHLRYLALCDDHFEYKLDRSIDQTRRGAVCHIELMMQKRSLGRAVDPRP